MFVNISSQQRSRDCIDSFFFLVFQRLKWKSIDKAYPKCQWDTMFGNAKIVWESIEHNQWPPRICNAIIFNQLVPSRTWSGGRLNAQFYEGYSYFSTSNCWVIFFFFLPSKLDVQCMVIVKKEQNKILFQITFNLMFNKYNKQCKVGEGLVKIFL